MDQDSLQRALMALSERFQVSQELLASQLQQAQARLLETQQQLAEVDTQLERLLNIVSCFGISADGPIEGVPTRLQRLELLERALERLLERPQP